MINASTIMAQYAEWLEDSQELDGFRISRGEFVNEDAGQAINGWLCLYRRSVLYEPGQLSDGPNNYDATFTFNVMVQRTSLKSGADAEDLIEESVKAVIDRIVTGPRDYIDHFSQVSVDYDYIETDRKTMYFQGALLTFTVEISQAVD